MKNTIIIITLLVFQGCASSGNKALFNSNKIDVTTINIIYAYEPEQDNFEFYRKSLSEEYFSILEEQFTQYDIKVLQGDSLRIKYFDIKEKNPTLKQKKADLIVICKIKRNIALGTVMDFRADYKFLSSETGELLYESKTISHTTVGIPSEENQMRTAIEKGLLKFKQDYLSRK